MIGISKLLLGTVTPGDVLRYGRSSSSLPSHMLQFSADKKPVVVWNVTRRCNLHCLHCYSSSQDRDFPGELTTAEGFALLEDLAQYGVPVVLFSGGEPLSRPDLFDLMLQTRKLGMRAVLSTNGTLITPAIAERLMNIGLSYVGISLDGVGPVHDRFRGSKGAFDRTLEGIRACRDADLRVGLRFTITRHNAEQLDAILDLAEREEIPRICVYHLAYSGRAAMKSDLTPEETREAVIKIADRVEEWKTRGIMKDVLTVGNHADGVLMYQRVAERDRHRATEVRRLLEWNGGNSSGIGLAAISWDGTVYPDQFWRNRPVGNIRTQRFSEIWSDEENELLSALRDRKRHLTGRCGSCRWLALCNGNLRERAEAATGDVWGDDPACYLTDEEIY
jgi:radical SAM protein with 4Fe4S-binding SPASM domain